MIAERFKNHELWGKVLEAKEYAENFSSSVSLDEEEKEVVTVQVPAMSTAVLYHRTNASGFYAESLLDSMHQSWMDIGSYLEQLEQSPSQLGKLQAALENVRDQLAKWPTYFALRGGAVPASVHQFDELAESQAKRIAFLEETIESKNKEFDERDAEHAQELNALRNSVEGLKREIEARDDEIKRQEESIAALTTQHNETFNQAQEGRQDSWKAWLDEHDAIYDSAVEQQLSKLRAAQDSGEEILVAMQTQRDEVEKVSGKIAEGILAKGYNSYATRDWLLGLFFVLLGGIGVWKAVGSLTQALAGLEPNVDTSWQWTLLKVTVTLLITAAATISFAFARQFFCTSGTLKAN